MPFLLWLSPVHCSLLSLSPLVLVFTLLFKCGRNKLQRNFEECSVCPQRPINCYAQVFTGTDSFPNAKDRLDANPTSFLPVYHVCIWDQNIRTGVEGVPQAISFSHFQMSKETQNQNITNLKLLYSQDKKNIYSFPRKYLSKKILELESEKTQYVNE